MWQSCLVLISVMAMTVSSAPEPPQGDPVPHAVDHSGSVQFSSPAYSSVQFSSPEDVHASVVQFSSQVADPESTIVAVDHSGRVQFSSPAAAPSTIVVDQFMDPLPPPKKCKNKAGFSVRKASTKTLMSSMASPTALQFQEVLTNQGGWEPGTNAFVAPCDGTYYFAFQALSNFGWGATVALMKNKEYQVTAYGDEAGYQAASNSAVLFLNADDLVWLQIQGNSTIYEHPNKEAYTTFSGYLLESFHTPDEL